MNARTLSLKLIAAAAAALPLLAHASPATGEIAPDGWQYAGAGIHRYVGPPAGSIGKTRAEVRAELEAFRSDPVTADGWRQTGDGYQIYVGAPAGLGKTRAEVLAELEAFRRNPVTADGWRQTGDGYQIYVGVPAPASSTRADASIDAPTRTQ